MTEDEGNTKQTHQNSRQILFFASPVNFKNQQMKANSVRIRYSEMDPAIWSRLPDELLEQILCFLPLRTFLNLRSTCKYFKSLLYSPSFISKYSSSSSTFPSFLLLSHPQCYHEFPLYEPTLGTWRNLSLSDSVSLPSAAAGGCTLVSSSNGLFCFSLPRSSSFLICNLLAGSSRIIDFPIYPFAYEFLTLVSTPTGYRIFTLCSYYSSDYALVYDSKDQSWRKFNGFECILSDNTYQEGVFHNGYLYFTTPEPFSIVCFDLDTGKWEKPVMILPNELTFARLVGDGEGKLYLIGGFGRNGISRGMKLWELSNGEGSGIWIEVESLPELMSRKFMSVCYHNYEHVYCFWHQGMICVCCYTWPEILYYKVSKRTWHWLAKCPSLPNKWSCGFRWFSFVPELYALV